MWRAAGAHRLEGASRRLRPAIAVESPAGNGPVRAHAARVVGAGTNGCECAWGRVSAAAGVPAPAGDGVVGADAAGVVVAGVDGEPAGGGLRAAEGPSKEAADVLTVVALAGGFGGGAGAEGALVDLDVAGVAEVGFDDVVEGDAGRGPGGGGDGASGLTVEGPGEDGADVVAVVGLTGSLGARVKRALVDADVAVVAEVGFDDVVERDAGGGPLGAGRGRRRRGRPGAPQPARRSGALVYFTEPGLSNRTDEGRRTCPDIRWSCRWGGAAVVVAPAFGGAVGAEAAAEVVADGDGGEDTGWG